MGRLSCTGIDYALSYFWRLIVTFMVFCGDKTCCHNRKGKCENFKIALNEQGMCMGYNPIIVPNSPIVNASASGEEHKIGF